MSTLTADSLRTMVRQFRDMYPPPPAYDLYPHDLDPERCYEIKTLDESFKGAFPRTCCRKMLVVPRLRLEAIYYQMRDAGLDVRLEPRYGSQSDALSKQGE